MRERHLLWAGIAAAFALAAAAYYSLTGVRVTVANKGDETVYTVVVHVTGRSYRMGEIAPAGAKTVRVRPTGKSHVEIEFTPENGQRVRLNAGGYFSREFNGAIKIEVEGNQITRFEDAVRIGPY